MKTKYGRFPRKVNELKLQQKLNIQYLLTKFRFLNLIT